MKETTYEVSGLTRLDAERMKNEPGVSVRVDPVPEDTYGEPATFTVIATIAGISALAAYLLRTGEGEQFDEEVLVRHPDGREERRRIHYKRTATEAPNEAIIRAIQGR